MNTSTQIETAYNAETNKNPVLLNKRATKPPSAMKTYVLLCLAAGLPDIPAPHFGQGEDSRRLSEIAWKQFYSRLGHVCRNYTVTELAAKAGVDRRKLKLVTSDQVFTHYRHLIRAEDLMTIASARGPEAVYAYNNRKSMARREEELYHMLVTQVGVMAAVN